MSENINFFLNDDDDSNDELNNNISLNDILKEINADEGSYLQNTDNLFHEVVNYNIKKCTYGLFSGK